jgi:hypothetical protein
VDTCDLRDGPAKWRRKTRLRDTPNGKAGTTYLVRYRTGDKCPNEALVTWTEDGKVNRRCLAHLNVI